MSKKLKQEKQEVSTPHSWFDHLTEDELMALDADREMFGDEDAEYFAITGCRDD